MSGDGPPGWGPPPGPQVVAPTQAMPDVPPPTSAMDVPPPTLSYGAPPVPPGAPAPFDPGFGPPPAPPGDSGFGPPPVPPGPSGPGFGPPGPPGPGPGPGFGPAGPGFGPPPGPPGGKSSTTLIVVAVIAVLALAGIAFAVTSGSDDDGGSVAAGEGGDGPTPEVTTIDPDDFGDAGDSPADDIPLPGSDEGDDGSDVEPPDDFETTPEVTDPPLAEAEAAVNDCIAVDSGGYFTGTGSCSDGGTPYSVTEVVEGTQTCSDPEASFTPSGDYLLCLQVNLVETYCYVFPEGASGGVDGWITVASACEAPGTVHVIDIVPGADNGDLCTSDYEWNYWYGFVTPHMVACVMKY